MYVAVMGYGVVGSGVVELFGKNHGSIVRRSTQTEMEIRYILDLRDFPGDPNEEKFTKDFQKILQDEEVKIVVETMGGLHPAYEYVLACLKAGKKTDMRKKTRRPTSKALTPAARFAFWHLWHLVSMCIRMAFIRKALPKSICGMWNIFALGAA